MTSRLILAISLMILTLAICGMVIGVIIANHDYREPIYAYPVIVPPQIATIPPEEGNYDHLFVPPSQGGRSHYYPRLPEELADVSDLTAESGSLYLTWLDTLEVRQAGSQAQVGIMELIDTLEDPPEQFLVQGYVSSLPASVLITPLGLSGETLYLLLTMRDSVSLSNMAEAMMLDALILSMLSFPGVEQVQFVVDINLGYQGRMDLSQPCDQHTLFSRR
ncbi:MAG: GerMN domain-containing protein [Symbiobacteriaceae bacterium]|nr:GerMN domain-containing protein [Symbiobacteriaceae bacterium]